MTLVRRVSVLLVLLLAVSCSTILHSLAFSKDDRRRSGEALQGCRRRVVSACIGIEIRKRRQVVSGLKNNLFNNEMHKDDQCW